MQYGECDECRCDAQGSCGRDLLFYCHGCWDEYEFYQTLRSYRCITFAAVYNLDTGKRMGIGAAVDNHCAERDALWKLDDIDVPKAIVVCRYRKNRNNTRASTGDSKPCAQCILAMQMYNVKRVCYSMGADDYRWMDVDRLQNDYETRNKCIVVM